MVLPAVLLLPLTACLAVRTRRSRPGIALAPEPYQSRDSWFRPLLNLTLPLTVFVAVVGAALQPISPCFLPHARFPQPTSRKHTAQRRAVRLLWRDFTGPARPGHPHVVLRFFVGQADGCVACRRHENRKLEAEAAAYNDIVVLNFVDSYRNLTRKSEGAARWASSRFFNFQYFLKVDDDVFVDVDATLQFLSQQPLRRRREFYFGVTHGGARVARTPRENRKNWDTYWPRAVYPDYNGGPFYVLSMGFAKIVGNAYDLSEPDDKEEPNEDANTAIQLWRAGHAPTPNTQNIYVLCHGNTRDLRWTRRSDSLQCAHTCAHILAAHIVSPSRIARLARERMANKARLESEISEAKQHGGRLQSGALPFRGHMACCNRGMCVN